MVQQLGVRVALRVLPLVFPDGQRLHEDAGPEVLDGGYQYHSGQVVAFPAWAVRPGDIVPVPAAVWLFGSAMGVFGIVRRRVLAGAGA